MAMVRSVTGLQLTPLAHVVTYDARISTIGVAAGNVFAGCLFSAGFELDLFGLSEPSSMRTKP